MEDFQPCAPGLNIAAIDVSKFNVENLVRQIMCGLNGNQVVALLEGYSFDGEPGLRDAEFSGWDEENESAEYTFMASDGLNAKLYVFLDDGVMRAAMDLSDE